ncbi:MAG: VWA domain-containing protein [Deltaproteobacteria bacterium]|nr:VWA domain-containing protein [Deltaproteobacteria bacterium]
MRSLVIGAWLALTLACTQSNFYIPPVVLEHPIDNKVAVSGAFCAEGADDLESFLKIMFIIDRSNSMQVTDKNNRRIEAVAEVINEFIEDPETLRLQAGVEFALVSFWGDVAVHTRNKLGLPGFSDNGTQVLSNLVRMAETSSNTGYDKALATAFQILDTDMARMTDTARPRSSYQIFFLSDGMPFPNNCSNDSNSLRAAIGGAARIKALEALYKIPVAFSTGFAAVDAMFTSPVNGDECRCLGITSAPMTLASDCYGLNVVDPNAPDFVSKGAVTRKLLSQMAAVGGGTFLQFRNGDAINFLDFEFAEARRLYAMSNFIVANTNARADHDHVDADSDGDGLTDLEEADLGTSPYWRDTDGDGFADGIEWRFRLSGFDPLDPTDAQCSAFDRVDADSDSLLDCEEMFLGTLRRAYDTDADGIADSVEVQSGGDANSATPLFDHQNDADADGGTNADELRWHTDPKIDDVGERAAIAYDYTQTELPIMTGQACYDFRVTNISLASTKGTPATRARGFCVTSPAAACGPNIPCTAPYEVCDLENGLCHDRAALPCLLNTDCTAAGTLCGNAPSLDGWNRIMLYMAQTPYDDPLSEPLYRIACIEPRYIEERDLKIPANGRFELPARRPSDTYAPAAVLEPNKVACHVSNNQDCGLDTLWCQFANDGSTCSCCKPPPMNCSSDRDCDRRLGDGVGRCSTTANASGLRLCTNANTENGVNCGLPCRACADGKDNDNDGNTDYPFDPDCFDSMDDSEDPGVECSNGIDDDGDGSGDWPADPGCGDAYDTTEGGHPIPLPRCGDPGNTGAGLPECANGLDDDGNGLCDFPVEPGCFAANDPVERLDLNARQPGTSNLIRACNDGLDNDGDGLIDYGAGATTDPGCADPEDVDENGPNVCFYCELASDVTPGQCDLKSGHCRAYAGMPPGRGRACGSSAACNGGSCTTTVPPNSIMQRNTCATYGCASDADCRGSRCDTDPTSVNYRQCRKCLANDDCDSAAGAGDGICDVDKGWCLNLAPPSYAATACTADSDCGGRPCAVDVGVCAVDPYGACGLDSDCAKGDRCSTERGFCLRRTFETTQCTSDADCGAGAICDPARRWCVPVDEGLKCKHDDVCPFGDCQEAGWCDQQTFVFPEDFNPDVDCLHKY